MEVVLGTANPFTPILFALSECLELDEAPAQNLTRGIAAGDDSRRALKAFTGYALGDCQGGGR
ncbi:hypothetical protein [Methylobacterium sp. CM6247]